MNKKKYSIIVSDYDCTLAEPTVSDKNKEMIFKYLESGGHFIVSTGRAPFGIIPQLKEWGYYGIVSTFNGSLIVDIESGDIIFDKPISCEATLKIVKKLESLGLGFYLHDKENAYTNIPEEDRVKSPEVKSIVGKTMTQFVEEESFSSYGVLAIVDEKKGQAVADEVKSALEKECSIKLIAGIYLDISALNVSKGSAINVLSNYYQCPIENIIAVGDQLNDIAMIEQAGLGIAVKNAVDELKDCADFVTEYTCKEDAIAYVIEKFGFIE